jgi:anti-sigma regulatory factor (Ser/Thr protein kinase)
MKRTREFSGSLENLAEICDFISQCAEGCGLSASEVYAVQLAVDEAATNIVEHAYKGHTSDSFEITCEVVPEGFQVIMHDRGQAFDPAGIPQPMLDVPLEELRSRGLGIFLMRKMMDVVEYKFIPEEGNVLRMVKKKGG